MIDERACIAEIDKIRGYSTLIASNASKFPVEASNLWDVTAGARNIGERPLLP